MWLASEYRPPHLKPGQTFYQNKRIVFDFEFEYTHYGGLIGWLIKKIKNKFKKYRTKNELYKQFKELEKNMVWFANEKIKTFKTED
ncbi:hypothetical protein GW950_00205 [Candidatus Wolfebacteria bacterium]|nr:hypothetical protein [Candidatus Wolfebacteria bacterium]